MQQDKTSGPPDQTAARPFFRDSVIYAASEGIEALVPFLLLPLLTRTLSPVDYGFWVLYVAAVSLARPLLGLGLADIIRIKFFRVPQEQLLSLVETAAYVSGVSAVAVTALVYGLPAEYVDYFQLPLLGVLGALLTAGAQSIFYLILAIFQFQHRARWYLLLMVLYSSSSIILSATFLAAQMGWLGVVLARIIGVAVAAIAGTCILKKTFDSRLWTRRPKLPNPELLSLCLRYLPAAIGPLIIPLAARIIIARHVSVAEVAMFGIAALFSSVVLLVGNAFRLSLQPRFFLAVSLHDTRKLHELGLFLLLFFLVLPIGVLLIVTLGPILFEPVIGRQFSGAYPLIAALCIASFAQVLFECCQVIYQAFGKVALISAGNILVIALALSLQISMVDSGGALGVARAIAIAYATVAIPYILGAFYDVRRLMGATNRHP